MLNLENEIKVSVCMSAYNHEEFIEEALTSILGQQCNFEYEIILSNDKSSDHTHRVITAFIENHEFKHRIKYFNQENNLGINGNLIFTLEQTQGKYIALLEGDDYWVDKQKLQKQFNFLEDNADFSICTAAYETNIISGGTTVIKLREDVPGKTYTFEKSAGFRPHYLNMFFVKKSLDVNRLKNFTYSGDNVIFIMCLSKGKGYFFNQVMGFRRNHIGGAWSSKNLLERLEMSSGQFISLYQYPEYKKLVRPILYYYYADLIASEKEQNRYIFSALKLVRTPKELMYFLKKIFRHKFKSITKFEEI